MIGTRIQHYEIRRKLGEGGMGEVYLADDTKLKRQVALKFLPLHLSNDPDFKSRFEHEAVAAAALNHPNIVTVYELSEHEGRLFIAMEHVEGKSLETLIGEGKLSVAQALDYTGQITAGLGKAHAAGIVHRDIKPSNILIDTDGRARVLDFGLAKSSKATTQTKIGTTLGTLQYESPEQAAGADVDQRSDLYSLGALFYEMISGQPPFVGEYEQAIRASILNDTPEPLSRYKADVPDEAQRIVSKLLDKDPGHRYQTADGLTADLRKLSATSQERPRPNRLRLVIATAGLVIVIGAVASLLWPTRIERVEGPTRKMIAVLPFENLGAAEDEYFADGMTEEITSRLAAISELGVISRTSAIQYKNATMSLRDIAAELGVDYILEGTVRWDKTGSMARVRITPQLIEVESDAHLWSERFDQELVDIFAVQAQIASKVVSALGVTLVPGSEKAEAQGPTQNLQAYDFYLRGRDYWDSERQSELAKQMFEQAVALDSSFAAAHAELTRLYGYLYINLEGSPSENLRNMREAAESAYRLSPDGFHGHYAQGYYHYYGSRDYERALSHFEQALELQPNSSDILAAMGYVMRRQSRWAEAVANQEAACSLDPRSVTNVAGLGLTYFLLHDMVRCQEVFHRALRLAPDNETALLWNMLMAHFGGLPDSIAGLRLKQYERHAAPSRFAVWAELADYASRRYESALSRRNRPAGDTPQDSIEFYCRRGVIYEHSGQGELSRIYYDSARVASEAQLAGAPDQAEHHENLADVYSGLGRYDEAIAHAEKSIELLPMSLDAVRGANILRNATRVFVRVGAYDRALDLIEYQVEHPSRLQLVSIHRHPQWDPLRKHPRFVALLEKYPVVPIDQ